MRDMDLFANYVIIVIWPISWHQVLCNCFVIKTAMIRQPVYLCNKYLYTFKIFVKVAINSCSHVQFMLSYKCYETSSSSQTCYKINVTCQLKIMYTHFCWVTYAPPRPREVLFKAHTLSFQKFDFLIDLDFSVESW
jgi:hypothetical protein